jgi:hypothetical protein
MRTTGLRAALLFFIGISAISSHCQFSSSAAAGDASFRTSNETIGHVRVTFDTDMLRTPEIMGPDSPLQNPICLQAVATAALPAMRVS